MKRSSVNVLFFDVRIDRPAKRNQSSIEGLPVILQCITLILPHKLTAKLCVITEGDMTFEFSEFPASSSPSGRRYLTTTVLFRVDSPPAESRVAERVEWRSLGQIASFKSSSFLSD